MTNDVADASMMSPDIISMQVTTPNIGSPCISSFSCESKIDLRNFNVTKHRKVPSLDLTKTKNFDVYDVSPNFPYAFEVNKKCFDSKEGLFNENEELLKSHNSSTMETKHECDTTSKRNFSKSLIGRLESNNFTSNNWQTRAHDSNMQFLCNDDMKQTQFLESFKTLKENNDNMQGIFSISSKEESIGPSSALWTEMSDINQMNNKNDSSDEELKNQCCQLLCKFYRKKQQKSKIGNLSTFQAKNKNTKCQPDIVKFSFKETRNNTITLEDWTQHITFNKHEGIGEIQKKINDDDDKKSLLKKNISSNKNALKIPQNSKSGLIDMICCEVATSSNCINNMTESKLVNITSKDFDASNLRGKGDNSHVLCNDCFEENQIFIQPYIKKSKKLENISTEKENTNITTSKELELKDKNWYSTTGKKYCCNPNHETCDCERIKKNSCDPNDKTCDCKELNNNCCDVTDKTCDCKGIDKYNIDESENGRNSKIFINDFSKFDSNFKSSISNTKSIFFEKIDNDTNSNCINKLTFSQVIPETRDLQSDSGDIPKVFMKCDDDLQISQTNFTSNEAENEGHGNTSSHGPLTYLKNTSTLDLLNKQGSFESSLINKVQIKQQDDEVFEILDRVKRLLKVGSLQESSSSYINGYNFNEIKGSQKEYIESIHKKFMQSSTLNKDNVFSIMNKEEKNVHSIIPHYKNQPNVENTPLDSSNLKRIDNHDYYHSKSLGIIDESIKNIQELSKKLPTYKEVEHEKFKLEELNDNAKDKQIERINLNNMDKNIFNIVSHHKESDAHFQYEMLLKNNSKSCDISHIDFSILKDNTDNVEILYNNKFQSLKKENEEDTSSLRDIIPMLVPENIQDLELVLYILLNF